jgi:hypothetical protein
MEPLFIKLKDGQPIDHPIALTNFMLVFPQVDLNNPGPDFAKFVRVNRSEVDKYEVITGDPTYQWVGDVIKDVWPTRPMTDEERAELDYQEDMQ